MKVAFYISDKDRCKEFARHFVAGVKKHGDTIEIRSVFRDPAPDTDVAVIMAVKERPTFAMFKKHMIPIVYLDKAYNRSWDYRRIAIGAHQPTLYLGKWGKPDDRRRKFGWEPRPWREQGNHILFAWSDDRDHVFRGWPLPEMHAEYSAIRPARKYSNRPFVYRRKPNSQPVYDIVDCGMSKGAPLQVDLEDAHALVTPGTSTCLEALLMGIPTIALDDAIVRNISATDIVLIEKPYLAPENRRLELLNDLAYCQYSTEEFASGLAWTNVRPVLHSILMNLYANGVINERPSDSLVEQSTSGDGS